jgi:2-polyprenyl-6-hydroxyphenyl methylase / 3-demethylubiquinone-9 3-methyltransferase
MTMNRDAGPAHQAALPRPAHSLTVDEAEIAHFGAEAHSWWDPNGIARWIHRYNPVRIGHIRDAACDQFGRDAARPDCLEGLRMLDIGCGAGLLSEPLAQLGAAMVGADPAPATIEAARRHARESGIAIDYRCVTAEALAAAGERFDVVLAMDVVEHVADFALFLQCCAALTRPGGLMILSTINRTVQSFVCAIVFGEYILRMLPRGSHQWRRFRTPGEIGATVAPHGFVVADVTGVTWDLFARALRPTRSTNVTYLLTARHIA